MELLLILMGSLGLGFTAFDFAQGADDDDTGAGANTSANQTVHETHIYGDNSDNALSVSGDSFAHGSRGGDTLNAEDISTAYGGAGDDNLSLSDDATGYGGWGEDTITAQGTSEAFGGVSADVLTVGADAIGHGDRGDDTILAGGESWGDNGNDDITIEIGEGTIVGIYGGAGSDTITGYSEFYSQVEGQSSVYGDGGDDVITTGNLVIFGGNGHDTLTGDPYDGDDIYGGNGHDVMSGGGQLYGGNGADTMTSTWGTAYGEGGRDVITARYGYGGSGDDILTAEPLIGEGGVTGNSEIYGGSGNDTLWGHGLQTYENGPAMVLSGGVGDDVVHAYGGDRVFAGAGNDTVFTNSNDLAHTTEVTLGTGADTMVMALTQPDDGFGGNVVVKDFNPATDHLALIVAPNAAAQVQYTITPNLVDNYTEIVFSQTGTTETLTYRFSGLTTFNASHVSLYENEAAVLAGTSYQTLV